LPEEVDFILREAARYLERAPTWDDVRSCWVGLRPLVSPPNERGADTRSISREHYIETAADGLVTVTGGKWTTYRAMAEDVLRHCMAGDLLPRREAGATRDCVLVGADQGANRPVRGADLSGGRGLHAYGSEAAQVAALPGCDRMLGPGLSEAMVRFAARHEYARTVEDVLARRQRLLFTDAAEAARAAPAVAQVLNEETGCPPQLESFLALAAQYLRPVALRDA
jgi:glycerol-3-phosphate dehydrogenase